jgi:hypothetical protein
VYAHLASIAVAPGQSIKPGQFLGMEGGTGRVKSSTGTIASVDFLAPAPVGQQQQNSISQLESLTGPTCSTNLILAAFAKF